MVSLARRQSGVTYVGLLFIVALAGVSLGGVASLWSLESRREKEKELLFVGEAYRRAVASYYENGPNGIKEYPQKLEDLVEDRRHPKPMHHLRRLYREPMSQTPDWILLRQQGRIVGVASSVEKKPIKIAGFLPQQEGFEAAVTYRDWQFSHAGAAVVGGEAAIGAVDSGSR